MDNNFIYLTQSVKIHTLKNEIKNSKTKYKFVIKI